MKVVLLLLSLLSSARAAECPKGAFIAGDSDALPPIGRLIVFWPRTKKPSELKPVVELPAGVSVPFVLQRLSQDARWTAYALTIVGEPKMYIKVDGAGPRRSFFTDAHWPMPLKAAAYRLEWVESGTARTAVLPAESKCFPWPAGAKATGLHANGRDAPL